MIIDFFISVFVGIFNGFLDTVPFISIPINLMQVLSTLVCYGAWVVGADLMLVCFSVITSVYLIRLSIGVIIFIWKLLPLT